MPESTITPYSGTMNLATDSDRQKTPLSPNETGNLSIEFLISEETGVSGDGAKNMHSQN
jgi:hypothetical protein